MLDIQFIRNHMTEIEQAITDKGAEADLKKLLALDDERRQLIGEIQAKREAQNLASRQGTDNQDHQASRVRRQEITHLEKKLSSVKESFLQELEKVPNLPSKDTPLGQSEQDNQVTEQSGQVPTFDFEPRPHWEMKNWIEQDRAVRISGKRFTFLQGDLVLLHFALIRFGFEVLADETKLKEIIKDKGLKVSSKPFVPLLPPTMMTTAAYRATGRLHTGGESFKLADDDLWLTGSSEHTMCAYFNKETIKDPPQRFVGYNTAYRREVGSDGQDTRGVIRQRQFDKLEMESFSSPKDGLAEHHFLVAIQQYLVTALGLPFQTVLKCTADMGHPNIRGVDLETWFAGQSRYRETHSADYLGDYQTRGLETKVIVDGQKVLAHTNDATVFAQRTLLAILENNQQADGRVRVPKVLVPYLNKEYI